MGEHTALPWDFRDGFILANGEALRLVGVQIPMCVGPQRREAIANARLIITAVNTQPAVADLVKALEEAATQITYLHEKFQRTGTGETALSRARSALFRFRELEKAK